MDDEQTPHNAFILVWDCYGLEACHDVTATMAEADQIEKENIFERLKFPEDEPHNAAIREVGNIIRVASLRARFNPQRSYEMYWINTDPEISKEDLEQHFDTNPQAAADIVRKLGKKLFSYRNNEPERVIK